MKQKTKFDFSAAYDEMFMDDAGRAENKLKKIYEIPLSEIDDFPDHPYLVKDDEDKGSDQNGGGFCQGCCRDGKENCRSISKSGEGGSGSYTKGSRCGI